MTRFTLGALLAASTAVAHAHPGHPTGPEGDRPAIAEVIYLNANVYTADDGTPRAEAFAVAGGEFVAVGSRAEVEHHRGEYTETVDLRGLTVLPGLIDAHGHLTGLGAIRLGVIDLAGTTSYQQVIDRVVEQAERTPEGEWVLGRGWDHESWPERELPTHDELSAAVPDHPVWLGRVDGHAALANAAAMEAAGVDADTASPEGGEVLKDEDGRPTGVFVDNAEGLVERVVPAGARGRMDDMILAGQQACFEVGLVSVQDMGGSPGGVEVYRRLEREGLLKLRMDLSLSANYAVRYFEENAPQHADASDGERVSVRAAKLYVDGAMGSRGAWLLEPYEDRPVGPGGEPYVGLAVMQPDLIEFISRHGLQRGYQLRVHAIGDRGNREVLDAFERAAASTGEDLAAARFRVEHAQLLDPEDIPRFAEMGVIASMQATHATSDMRWVRDRVGPDRALGAYAWGDLLRSGAVIAGGSDFPVESHNPFLGFYASITRQNSTGWPSGGWYPGQRMTREETLRSMTIDAAFAGFAEDVRGSISEGKRADFIVIDRDVMTVEPAEILDTRVLRTVIDGEEVYRAGR
ncbi:MAG: amidohydrolase family protein [Planctomycetota bacterium]